MEVVARYAGYGGEADMAWKVGRIMLKYRPIAPKPVTGGAVTPAPLDMKSSSGRGKRKGCSKEGRFRRGRKSTKKTPGVFSEEKNYNYNYNNNNNNIPVVTLPLMPVTPERKEEEDLSPATPSPTASNGHVAVSYFGPQSWKRVGSTTNSNNNNRNSITGVVVAPRPVRPVGSWVTVECVTYTWQEGDIPADLEGDTCPVFFSDARGERVTWTNEAYRRMVVGPSEEEEEKEEVEGDGGDEEEVRVALVTRGMVPPREKGVMCFTCRVRVRYTCRRGGKVSMAAPCDVWRMAGGGLAWRLDVKAALSLSLGS